MVTQFQSVEALLGMKAEQHTSLLTLPSFIENGVPVAALDHLADNLAPGDAQFKFRLIPKATLERRRKSTSKRLTSGEGNRLVRLANVFRFALSIYKETERAREFLVRPHPMMDGKPPLDIALATSPGADLVIDQLGRAAYGGGV